MRSRFICLAIAASSLLVSGCFSPDPPLLHTSLPNGYAFHSNGGYFGYVAAPLHGRLGTWFGMLDSGREAWCGEFGWSGAMVVCRYEAQLAHSTRALGFFVLDTVSGGITIAADEAAVLALLRRHGIDTMPSLERSHFFHTTRKR